MPAARSSGCADFHWIEVEEMDLEQASDQLLAQVRAHNERWLMVCE